MQLASQLGGWGVLAAGTFPELVLAAGGWVSPWHKEAREMSPQ